MKKKVLDKLRSRRGDSIAEVLISLLISVVALVMLAAMITSSTRLIQRSRDAMEKYDAANNVLASMPETVPSTVKTVTKASGVQLNVKNAEKTVRLKMASGNLVTVYENEGYAGKTVVAYKMS
jgi:type II secretory pathway component PulJ